ncbi:nitrate- and nitrite sensing domain-containing protein [Streptomyces diastatochromogenes]|nr:nitrate- and nitrite sensing domain-containing protein [Streptomyces diastatochromogenes]
MAIVLAVPTCLLLALTGLGVADRAHDWSAARATESQVGILLQEQDLVRELQRERGLTNGLLSGAEQYRDDVRGQRARTDTARTSLRAALSKESGDLPGARPPPYARPSSRSSTSSPPVPPSTPAGPTAPPPSASTPEPSPP